MSKITIATKERRFPVAKDLYGIFFEDINRAGDAGLYPELLRNRAFEDSLVPERCTLDDDGKFFTTPEGWRCEFNGGEGTGRVAGRAGPHAGARLVCKRRRSDAYERGGYPQQKPEGLPAGRFRRRRKRDLQHRL